MIFWFCYYWKSEYILLFRPLCWISTNGVMLKFHIELLMVSTIPVARIVLPYDSDIYTLILQQYSLTRHSDRFITQNSFGPIYISPIIEKIKKKKLSFFVNFRDLGSNKCIYIYKIKL